MAQRQINIRMDDSDVDVLEAAAFLDRQAVPDLVRSVLLERVSALRREPQVQDMLRARSERDATKSGVLTPLESKRRANRSGDS